MKNHRFTSDFFNRPTPVVARGLLGKFLARRMGKKIVRVIITETEAYCGKKDLACHASKGRTKRTEVMFGPAGHAYVYLIYGMYHCLNIVTGKVDYPAAVLIRGACPVRGRARALAPEGPWGRAASNGMNGPGKLCRFLRIDKTLNDEDLIKSKRLWVEEGVKLKSMQIGRSKRIGIDYAGPYKSKLWRFFVKRWTF